MQANYAAGAMTARPHSSHLMGGSPSMHPSMLPHPPPLFREQTELQAFAQTVRSRGFLDTNRRLARVGVRRPDDKYAVDETRLRELMNKIKIVENENSRLKLELGVLRRKSTRKRDDELDAAVDETRTLQVVIQNAAVEKELLAQSHAELEAQLTRRTQEYTRIEAKHTDLLVKFHELQKQYKHLQVMHSHVNKDIEIATQDKVFLETTCSRLTNENEDLQKAHKQLRERNLQLKAQNDNYGSSFDAGARELEGSQNRLDNATKALELALNTNNRILDECNGEKATSAILRTQLKKKKKELEAQSVEMVLMLKELHNLKNESFELAQKSAMQRRELSNTTEELAHVRKTLVEEVTALTERADRCQLRADVALEKHKLCEPLQEQLQEEIRELESAAERNVRDLAHTREDNLYLSKKHKEHAKEVRDLKRERKKLTQVVDVLTTKVKGLEEVVGMKKQVLAETSHNLHVVTGDNKRNLAAVENLTKLLKKVKHAHTDCGGTIKHLGSEIILKTQLFNSQLLQLRTDVQNESTKCMGLQRQLNSWRKRVDDSERIIKDMSDKLTKANEIEKESSWKKHELEEGKMKMQMIVDQITMDLQKANTTIAEQTRELGALVEFAQLGEKVKKAEQAKVTAEEKLEDAMKELVEKNKLAMQLTKEKNQLIVQLGK